MNNRNLDNLDVSVLAALEFFSNNKPAKLKLKQFKFPLVVGSGNAHNTALILFGNRPAIIADESTFSQTIKNYQTWIENKTITEAIVISASGEKDSIWETKLAKKYKLQTTLITCSPNSPATKFADKIITYQKLPEPYTYNTSTYLGMLLGAGQEKAKNIKIFLKKLKLPRQTRDFKNYQAYSFLLPDKFKALAPMLEIKKDELFGPHLSLRAFTFGEARHAKFVHPWKKELVISFEKNNYFGTKGQRLEIELPTTAGPAFLMALCYYLIGKIQTSKPPYFKRHIAKFCLTGQLPYGKKEPFPIIVK